jgi:hypothetical protein
MTLSPFDHEPDEELGRILREQLTGPAPEAFLRRLRSAIADSARGNEWDVLAVWARPRVMAVAVAAGFLLWVGAWFASEERPADQGVTVASLPAHTLVLPRVSGQDEFISAILDGR